MRTRTLGIITTIFSLACGSYAALLAPRTVLLHRLTALTAESYAALPQASFEGFLDAASHTGCSPTVISMLKKHAAERATYQGAIVQQTKLLERVFLEQSVVAGVLCLAMAVLGIALIRRSDNAT
jgi:hypothetical protein